LKDKSPDDITDFLHEICGFSKRTFIHESDSLYADYSIFLFKILDPPFILNNCPVRKYYKRRNLQLTFQLKDGVILLRILHIKNFIILNIDHNYLVENYTVNPLEIYITDKYKHIHQINLDSDMKITTDFDIICKNLTRYYSMGLIFIKEDCCIAIKYNRYE
jgi:hypothetical protein